ncbi:hypothetical protein IFO69_10545 [Echinicola sp. CAU 1574]|uniref:Uncharacterized protein n=1 Tax=Echinicola arenosa TaxID=2774144 RepID=A0ABR9ANJ2_9BACT|nr:hypothetical protein [Echinicola arenosa]MBD8489184.1 hypothetical protein [Echinicola arenosa]
MSDSTTVEFQLKEFKDRLMEYIPETFVFSGIKDKQLKKKISAVKNRYDQLVKITDQSKNYRPHCIYDLLFLTDIDSNPNNRYISLLRHIELTLKEIKKLINPALLPKVKDTVVQMLTAVDPKLGSNYQYLNFFAELLGIHFILKNGFNLEDIERPLPNGKKVDLVFKSEDDSSLLYMDLISYHNIAPDLHRSDDGFKRFLIQKFNEKIEGKTEGLNSKGQYLNINGENIPFTILPIIWGDPDSFLKYRDLIKRLEEELINVTAIVTLLTEIDDLGNVHYTFTTLSNVLERIATP